MEREDVEEEKTHDADRLSSAPPTLSAKAARSSPRNDQRKRNEAPRIGAQEKIEDLRKEVKQDAVTSVWLLPPLRPKLPGHRTQGDRISESNLDSALCRRTIDRATRA